VREGERERVCEVSCVEPRADKSSDLEARADKNSYLGARADERVRTSEARAAKSSDVDARADQGFRSQPAPRSSRVRLVVDHIPKSCGPPEYHLRSIKRLKRIYRQVGDIIVIGDTLTKWLHNEVWFRGGLVFKAHRLCVSLNSRFESNKEEEVWWKTPDAQQTPNLTPPPQLFSIAKP